MHRIRQRGDAYLFGGDFLARGSVPGCAFATASSFQAFEGFGAGMLSPFSPFVLYSVQENAFWCTEYSFGAKKGLLVYATHFQKHSVQKTGFYGTEGKFGAKNGLLVYGSKLLSVIIINLSQPTSGKYNAENCAEILHNFHLSCIAFPNIS